MSERLRNGCRKFPHQLRKTHPLTRRFREWNAGSLKVFSTLCTHHTTHTHTINHLVSKRQPNNIRILELLLQPLQPPSIDLFLEFSQIPFQVQFERNCAERKSRLIWLLLWLIFSSSSRLARCAHSLSLRVFTTMSMLSSILMRFLVHSQITTTQAAMLTPLSSCTRIVFPKATDSSMNSKHFFKKVKMSCDERSEAHY